MRDESCKIFIRLATHTALDGIVYTMIMDKAQVWNLENYWEGGEWLIITRWDEIPLRIPLSR